MAAIFPSHTRNLRGGSAAGFIAVKAYSSDYHRIDCCDERRKPGVTDDGHICFSANLHPGRAGGGLGLSGFFAAQFRI